MLRFDAFSPDSAFKRRLAGLTRPGVPVLLDDGFAVGTRWPSPSNTSPSASPPSSSGRRTRRRVPRAQRLRRDALGLHVAAQPLPDEHRGEAARDRRQGAGRTAGVRTDLDRIVAMWTELLREHGGPLLFGEFSIADAYFAPVVMRLPPGAAAAGGHRGLHGARACRRCPAWPRGSGRARRAGLPALRGTVPHEALSAAHEGLPGRRRGARRVARTPLGRPRLVVVGATPAEMIEAGYQPVGATSPSSCTRRRTRNTRWRAPSARPRRATAASSFTPRPRSRWKTIWRGAT